MKFSKISQLDALAFCFKTGYTISTGAVEPRPGPLHLTKEAFPMSEEYGPDFITIVVCEDRHYIIHTIDKIIYKTAVAVCIKVIQISIQCYHI